jgi:ATP-dependent RNA helicase RhlE
MSFETLSLAPEILRAVVAEGYTVPTPIQAQSIPLLLAGMDLLGCAQTGTGKTAAFALPILHLLSTTQPKKVEPAAGDVEGLSRDGKFHQQAQHGQMIRAFQRGRNAARHRRPIRALVLSPTRELASQIAESLATYGRNTRLRDVVIYGGVSQGPQVRLLQQGVDICIATPGRLVDLIQQGWVDLSSIEMFVLDEADRMLDMGFLPDLKRISNCLPEERQTVMFSATMPEPIQHLANQILRNPAKVTIAPEKVTTELVDQHVYHVAKAQKADLLTHLLGRPEFKRTIVFTQTKHGADRVCKQLDRAGILAEAIHGNKSQNARQRALNAFKGSQIRVLVATDVAARGIDVDNISHVIQFDLPNEPETYVHRIGRTGRAGATGLAISFCDSEQRIELRDIERLINRRLEVQKDHPEGIEILQAAPPKQNQNPPGKFRFQGAVRGRKPFGKSRTGDRPPHGERPNREGRPFSGGDRHRGDSRPEHRDAGSRHEGPRNERPQHAGPRSEGRRFEGERSDRPRFHGPRQDGPRQDGPRGEARGYSSDRSDRPQREFGGFRRDRKPGEQSGPRREERRFESDRPRRSEGRPDGPRQYGARPQGDRPQGDRPQGARPQGARPYGDRPQGDRPASGRPTKGFGGHNKFKFKAKRRPATADRG